MTITNNKNISEKSLIIEHEGKFYTYYNTYRGITLNGLSENDKIQIKSLPNIEILDMGSQSFIYNTFA